MRGLKSDQSGIERLFNLRPLSQEVEVEIRPKWD
mgnify:CR=1 FL=1